MVSEVLAQMVNDSCKHQGGRRRNPTPGPKQVRSADRREVKPASRMLSQDSRRDHSASTEGWSCSLDEPTQCYKRKGFGHYAKHCLSDEYYKVGCNGLPIQT